MNKWLTFLIVLIWLVGAVFVYDFNGKSRYREPNLPPFGEMQDPLETRYNSIVRLATETGRGFCTAWVVDKRYAVTAAHCINENGRITQDEMKFYDSLGNDTHTTVRAVAFDTDTDLGLLYGDFNKFQPTKVNFNEDGFPQEGAHRYITCGYPLGQKHLSCTPFVVTGTNYFLIEGKSHLIPGYSGGPVIDVSSDTAVAVNSAVNDTKALVAPIQGMLGLFRLE